MLSGAGMDGFFPIPDQGVFNNPFEHGDIIPPGPE